MRKLQYLLLTAVMFVISLAASAQAKMTVELKNGTNLSFYVSEISKITWTDGTNTPGGGDNDPGEQTVTGDATDVTSFSAKVTCYANNILENEATDLMVGIIYTSSGTPSKSNGTQVTVSKSSIGSDGKYTVSLSDLQENTTYQYRSFVYQSGIYFLGEVKNFTTKPQQAAVTFYTGEATNVNCYSAKVSAQMVIESSSVYNKLSYGICYGTTAEPATQQNVTTQDVSGTYSITLKGLTGGTVYYYRPFADIDGTIFYGPVSSFRTSDDNVVETGEADASSNVKSKLTIGGGAYSKLELGVCWSTVNETPMISDNIQRATEVGEDNCYISFLPAVTVGTYYYRAYVKIDGVEHYGKVKIMNVPSFKNTAVDLGLSVKWANMNVGADAPGAYGDYYAWGETETKSTYGWSTYFDSVDGSSSSFIKYDLDKKTQLDLEDDVAHVIMGGDWRMPTEEEWNELRTICTITQTTLCGVNGFIFRGPNGNSIFLPAAGCSDYKPYSEGYGSYWSSSLIKDDSKYAKYYHFKSRLGKVEYYTFDFFYRCDGRSVRAVCP